MLTEIEAQTLAKFRQKGTVEFSRNDYKTLQRVREKTREIIEQYQEALKIYLELTK